MSGLTRRPRFERWRPPARRVLPVLFALVAATGLLAAPGQATDVLAATPDLTVVGQRPLRRSSPATSACGSPST